MFDALRGCILFAVLGRAHREEETTATNRKSCVNASVQSGNASTRLDYRWLPFATHPSPHKLTYSTEWWYFNTGHFALSIRTYSNGTARVRMDGYEDSHRTLMPHPDCMIAAEGLCLREDSLHVRTHEFETDMRWERNIYTTQRLGRVFDWLLPTAVYPMRWYVHSISPSWSGVLRTNAKGIAIEGDAGYIEHIYGKWRGQRGESGIPGWIWAHGSGLRPLRSNESQPISMTFGGQILHRWSFGYIDNKGGRYRDVDWIAAGLRCTDGADRRTIELRFRALKLFPAMRAKVTIELPKNGSVVGIRGPGVRTFYHAQMVVDLDQETYAADWDVDVEIHESHFSKCH